MEKIIHIPIAEPNEAGGSGKRSLTEDVSPFKVVKEGGHDLSVVSIPEQSPELESHSGRSMGPDWENDWIGKIVTEINKHKSADPTEYESRLDQILERIKLEIPSQKIIDGIVLDLTKLFDKTKRPSRRSNKLGNNDGPKRGKRKKAKYAKCQELFRKCP
jgi:hypothetical protein